MSSAKENSLTCYGCMKKFPHKSNLGMHHRQVPICKMKVELKMYKEIQPQTDKTRAKTAELEQILKEEEPPEDEEIIGSSKSISVQIEKQTEEIRGVSKQIQSFKSPTPLAARTKAAIAAEALAKKNKNKEKNAAVNDEQLGTKPSLKRGREDPKHNAPTHQEGAPPLDPHQQAFKEVLERSQKMDRAVNTSRYLLTGVMDKEERSPYPFSRLEDQLFLQTLQKPWSQLQREKEGNEDRSTKKYNHCNYMLKDGAFYWPGIYCKARDLDKNAFKHITTEDFINRWKKITKLSNQQLSTVTRLEDQKVVANAGMNALEGYSSRQELEPWRFAKKLRMSHISEEEDEQLDVGEFLKCHSETKVNDADVLLDVEMKLHKLTFSRKLSEDDESEPSPLDNKLYNVVNKWFQLHKKTAFKGSIVFDPSKQKVSSEMLLPLFSARREFQRDDCYENLDVGLWARICKDIPMILTAED
jgi:hypothetical protein